MTGASVWDGDDRSERVQSRIRPRRLNVPPAADDFQPGDVITRTFKNGATHSWTVLGDPMRTRNGRGKLRVASQSGAVDTTLWRPDALPTGYTWRRP